MTGPISPPGLIHSEETSAAQSDLGAEPAGSFRLTGMWVLFLAASLLTATAMMAMNEADPDLWGHVQYGKELLHDGALQTRSTWNYTAIGHPWINHENLAEVALALADQWFGAAGLLGLKLLLTLTLLGTVTWRLLARGIQPVTVGLILIVLAQSIDFHWHFRPQIFGYTLFALMLALLDWCFAGWAGTWRLQWGWNVPTAATTTDQKTWSNWWSEPVPHLPDYSGFRMRQLYWLLPLGVLWVNTHGSFAAGVCVACAYLGLRAIETLCCWRSSGWGRVRRFGLIIMGVLLAMFLNPYGPRLQIWLLEDVYLPRPEIADWEGLPLFTAEGVGFWIILISSVFATWKTRQADWTQTVILLLLTWQSISHIRHLVWLAIAWSFWMAGPLDQVIRSLAQELAQQRPAHLPTNTRPSPLFVGLLCLWMVFVSSVLWPRITKLNVDRSRYPVAAMEFLTEHDLSGRTVVTFNWAQYALNCFSETNLPSRVAIDGRLRTCYPQEVLDIYFDFIFGNSPAPRYRSPRSATLDPTLALVHEDPELVLISRLQEPSVATIQANKEGWVLLYQDSLAQLWGRRDLFDNPHSLRYFPPSERHISEDLQAGYAAWPAIPQAQRLPTQIVSAR